MKLPSSIDLKFNKELVQSMIDKYGYARDVNQVGSIVYCKDEEGNTFQITQFHNNRRIAHFGSMTL